MHVVVEPLARPERLRPSTEAKQALRLVLVPSCRPDLVLGQRRRRRTGPLRPSLMAFGSLTHTNRWWHRPCRWTVGSFHSDQRKNQEPRPRSRSQDRRLRRPPRHPSLRLQHLPPPDLESQRRFRARLRLVDLRMATTLDQVLRARRPKGDPTSTSSRSPLATWPPPPPRRVRAPSLLPTVQRPLLPPTYLATSFMTLTSPA